MARGGYGAGSGVPLRDRVRAGQGGGRAEPEPEPESPPYPGRHCWVAVPADGPTPRPGLLVEWRAAERGRWEGRVVYVAALRTGRWALVDEWVPAEYLTPSDTQAVAQ